MVQEVLQGDESFEGEERSRGPSEVDNNQLGAINESNPFTTTWQIAKEFNVDHSTVILHLKQIGKVKKLNKWVLHAAAAAAKSLQSCPTLWDPIDGSPPGSTVPGILQVRTLEWVAVPSSRGSSQPRDQIQVSRISSGFFTVWATREAQGYYSG